MIDYRGYTGAFEFDPELRIFAGHVIDLQDEIYFEGDSIEALEASMRRAVDHYLEVCAARGEEPGKPFSGKLNVRLGSDVHRAAAVAAAVEGQSLNAWLTRVVAEAARDRSKHEASRRKPAPPPRRSAKGTKAGRSKG